MTLVVAQSPVMRALTNVLVFGAVLRPFEAQEVISDVTGSSEDRTKALKIKAEEFWKPILDTAEAMHMKEHVQLYAQVEAALCDLSPAQVQVRQYLEEGLAALKHADYLVLKQAQDSTQLASEQLVAPGARKEASFSFFSGGHIMSTFKQTLNRFVGEGTYAEVLLQQVSQRQADVLPMLRGTATIAGDVLESCRRASKRGFDVLKIDIYEKKALRGAGPTPDSAKAAANGLIEAAGETRHQFMGYVTGIANDITRDVQGRHDSPATTVVRASLAAEFHAPPPSSNDSKGTPGGFIISSEVPEEGEQSVQLVAHSEKLPAPSNTIGFGGGIDGFVVRTKASEVSSGTFRMGAVEV